MLKDEYFTSNETGELLPSSDAIREFYKTHGALDAWTDEWEPTGIPVEGKYIEFPDFSRTIKNF